MNPSKQANTQQAWYALAVARILLGWIFLWAFLDKTFGFGFPTPRNGAWINGGSPTTGYLGSLSGMLDSMFSIFTEVAWVDWLFMLGLLGIGSALILGIGIRIAAVTGTLLLFLLWLTSLPIATNPFVDEHVIYAALLWTVALGLSQQKLSLAKWWQTKSFAATSPWLW